MSKVPFLLFIWGLKKEFLVAFVILDIFEGLLLSWGDIGSFSLLLSLTISGSSSRLRFVNSIVFLNMMSFFLILMTFDWLLVGSIDGWLLPEPGSQDESVLLTLWVCFILFIVFVSRSMSSLRVWAAICLSLLIAFKKDYLLTLKRMPLWDMHLTLTV